MTGHDSGPAKPRTRARRRWIVAATLVAMTALVVSLPPVQAGASAAFTVAEGFGHSVPRPFAPEITRSRTSLGGVGGALYEPDGSPGPTILLAPGAAPAGTEDPRVVEVAHAISRSGRGVFIPDLEVYGEDLVPADVERIVRVAASMSETAGVPVVLVGVSFGGALSLLAAADPQLDGRVALVATFGAYFDLVGVLQAATTGASLVDGERIPWDLDPRAETIAQERITDLVPEPFGSQLGEALDGDRDPATLDPPVRAAYELLTNDDPARTFALAEQLPAQVRARLNAVSPSSVADKLADVPIAAMHAINDPVIPYGELRRIEVALPHARLMTLESFDHVDVDESSAGDWLRMLDDLRHVWRFTAAILEASSN